MDALVASLASRDLLDASGAATALLDLDGRYVYVNDAMCALTGWGRSALIGRDYTTTLHPEDVEHERARAIDLLAGRLRRYQAERRYVRADGEIMWVLASGALVRDTSGHAKLFLSQVQDISPLRRAEASARTAEALFRSAFDNAPIGMGLLTLEGRWLQVNAAFTEMVGYTATQLSRMTLHDISEASTREADLEALDDLASGRRRTYEIEKPFRHADGHLLWVRVSASTVLGPDGKPSRMVSQYEDVSDRRVADARLAHLALHDPLTGLANRALLMDRLAVALAQRAREGGHVAVAFCDLDDFKAVNDRQGHAAGDQVLLTVAEALRSTVRPGDTVARIGGDEFVVAGMVDDRAEALALVDRLRRAVDEAGVAASIGLATFPSDDGSPAGMLAAFTAMPSSLLSSADQAMYAEKARRKAEGGILPAVRGVAQ